MFAGTIAANGIAGTAGDFEDSFVPMDFLFKDLRFFALVMFYYTVVVLSKFLEKAGADYTVPLKKQTAA